MKLSKFIISTILVFCMLLSFSSCSKSARILNSVGSYEQITYYEIPDFQNLKIFAKYSYSKFELGNNNYFQKISANNQEHLINYIEHYEKHLDYYTQQYDLIDNYESCISYIDSDDYFYIYDYYIDEGNFDSQTLPEDMSYWNYDIYFFDFQSSTLYYLHDNI